MKALITGASSGIGSDMAKILCNMGYDVFGVARREDRLDALKCEIGDKFHPIVLDISKFENCYKLYDDLKNENIDILINNAGFGAFGRFSDIPLQKEIDMINTNISALHILTKLFLKDFKSKDKGYILNVGSSAGLTIGPLLATYYATKAYVVRLTQAIWRELKNEKSNVSISVLCPGPVKTEFDSVANVKFSLKGLESSYVARYAIKKMFKKQCVIVPGIVMKLSLFFSKHTPDRFVSKITYHVQHKKEMR